jgi:hypothetical protein
VNPNKEEELLEALRFAEEAEDAAAIERAVGKLSLYYMVEGRYSTAATYWERGAVLLERTTAADSQELGTYLHNMAALVLIPAGMTEGARSALVRARQIYSLHFKADAKFVLDVEQLLREIS